MPPPTVLLACVAIAAGCSGPDGGGGGPGGADAAGDGSGGGGGGDGMGPGGTDRRLYPISDGRVWTYDVTSTYTSCPAGRRDQRVLGTGTTEGRPTFRVSTYCGHEIHTSAEGDRVETYYNWGPTGWYRYLDEPVADAHTWTTTNGSATFTQTYHHLGTYEGREKCWKVVQNVSYTSYWIHCEGIGLVHSEMIDLGGGVIRARLVSTSF
jgi:hypothetical protein